MNSMESTLVTALTSVMTQVTLVVTEVGPKIALAAVAGIGLGSIGLGIRFLWRTFRGFAK